MQAFRRAVTPALRSRFFSTAGELPKNPWDIADNAPESVNKKYAPQKEVETNPVAMKLFKLEPASVAEKKGGAQRHNPPKFIP